LLEEAGEENVARSIATVQPPNREAFDRAVSDLARLGYLIKSETPSEQGGSLLLTKEGRRALTV
jgi:hypothetical protein